MVSNMLALQSFISQVGLLLIAYLCLLMQHGATLMSYGMRNNNNGETGDIHMVKVFPIIKSYCNWLKLMLLVLKPWPKSCAHNLVFRLGAAAKNRPHTT